MAMTSPHVALAEIDERVWEKIGRDIDAPTSDESQVESIDEKKVVISGFTIVEKTTIESLIQQSEKIGLLRKARSESEKLRRELCEKELEPLAVLPLKTWLSLCDYFELYRFDNISDKNKVKASFKFTRNFAIRICILSVMLLVPCVTSWYHSSPPAITVMSIFLTFLCNPTIHRLITTEINGNETAKEMTLHFMYTFGAIAIPIFAIYIGTVAWSEYWLIYGGIGFIVCMVVGFIELLAVGILLENTGIDKLFIKLCLRTTTKQKLIRKLWGNRCDTFNSFFGIQEINISFPSPPEDVASILVRAKESGYKIHVAAEEGAIGISYKNLQKAAEENLKKDPIIYVEKNGIIAVLAQFGEFPIEQNFIESIKKMELV